MPDHLKIHMQAHIMQYMIAAKSITKHFLKHTHLTRPKVLPESRKYITKYLSYMRHWTSQRFYDSNMPSAVGKIFLCAIFLLDLWKSWVAWLTCPSYRRLIKWCGRLNKSRITIITDLTSVIIIGNGEHFEDYVRIRYVMKIFYEREGNLFPGIFQMYEIYVKLIVLMVY